MFRKQVSEAVAKLPDPPLSSKRRLQAVATATGGRKLGAKNSALHGGKSRTSADF